MPHVITQSCCSDGSCVFACPVNCIHPTPDEPDFLTAEMLHIDPSSCVDCGACVDACPVEAIVPHTKLSEQQLPFLEINSSYFSPRSNSPRAKRGRWYFPMLAAVPSAPKIKPGSSPLRVAIVGSGPAGMYAADELLTQADVEVNVFDKLPTPYGLVRAGVAPDHQKTKAVSDLFEVISEQPGFSFYLNVDIGTDITHAELLRNHHAVIYAVGASSDRRLTIPGIELPNSFTATEFVNWVNALPDRSDLPVRLDHERAVIVGNGNVALDVARFLTIDPEELASTDISQRALDALRESFIREVVLVGRRGPEFSAFTLPEMVGLCNTVEVIVDAASRSLIDDALATVQDPVKIEKLEFLATFPTEPSGTRPYVRLCYQMSPHSVSGSESVNDIEFTITGTEEVRTIEAGLLLTSIGYRALPVRDVPFDPVASVMPNKDGRVFDPETDTQVEGTYVVGWLKRGPSGFIGTNKSCSRDTVFALVDDYNDGKLHAPTTSMKEFDSMVRQRKPSLVDRKGWRNINAAEIRRGQLAHRVRDKFTSIPLMVNAAKISSQEQVKL